MLRAILALSVLCLVVVASGCRMCAHPYDYCGPTFMGRCGESCDWKARSGSILSPGGMPMGSEHPHPELISPEPYVMSGPAPGVEEPAAEIAPKSSSRPVLSASSKGPRLR